MYMENKKTQKNSSVSPNKYFWFLHSESEFVSYCDSNFHEWTIVALSLHNEWVMAPVRACTQAQECGCVDGGAHLGWWSLLTKASLETSGLVSVLKDG